jgi:hypothetical protein
MQSGIENFLYLNSKVEKNEMLTKVDMKELPPQIPDIIK